MTAAGRVTCSATLVLGRADIMTPPRATKDLAAALKARAATDLAQHAGEGGVLWDSSNRIALAQVWLEKDQTQPALAALDAIGEGPGSELYRWDRLWLRARAFNVAGRSAEAEAAVRAAVAEGIGWRCRGW